MVMMSDGRGKVDYDKPAVLVSLVVEYDLNSKNYLQLHLKKMTNTNNRMCYTAQWWKVSL